jgi:putative transposase
LSFVGLRFQRKAKDQTMTDDRQALFEPIEKRADADFVRELSAFAAERLMEVEVEVLTWAAHGERPSSVQRIGW